MFRQLASSRLRRNKSDMDFGIGVATSSVERPSLRHALERVERETGVGRCSKGVIMATATSLTDKLSAFSELWSPKILTRFNGHDVMVVKLKGEFVWNSHPETDDFFLVLKGNLCIQL